MGRSALGGLCVMRLFLSIVALVLLTACSGTDTASGARSDAASSSSIAPQPAETSQPAATGAAATIAVPKVVGQRLDDATGVLTAAGLTKTSPTDGTGQGRVVLNPTNWVVQSQKPAAGARVTAGQMITLVVVKPSDASAGGAVEAGAVPNVVCKDLQTAQDTLQEAGFYNLGSQDGSGQGRSQLIDRNWVVTKQSVPAGSRPDPATRVVLTAVKFGEPTGSSGCPS
jgi:PASTA domain